MELMIFCTTLAPCRLLVYPEGKFPTDSSIDHPTVCFVHLSYSFTSTTTPVHLQLLPVNFILFCQIFSSSQLLVTLAPKDMGSVGRKTFHLPAV